LADDVTGNRKESLGSLFLSVQVFICAGIAGPALTPTITAINHPVQP
jgi:hypothetical protein